MLTYSCIKVLLGCCPGLRLRKVDLVAVLAAVDRGLDLETLPVMLCVCRDVVDRLSSKKFLEYSERSRAVPCLSRNAPDLENYVIVNCHLKVVEKASADLVCEVEKASVDLVYEVEKASVDRVY